MNSLNYDELYAIKIPEIPNEIIQKINNVDLIAKIEFNDKNTIYENKNIISEIGICKLKSEDFLVAMNVKMPNVKLYMVDWWYWWQAQEDKRYQVWFPGEHKSIRYNKKYTKYFQSNFLNFSENIQYPKERIGRKEVVLSIHFMSAIKFGLNKEIIENQKSKFICGNVGIIKGLIQHTKMVHYFIENEDGIELSSRFWLGNGLPRKIKKIIANETQAKEMAKHCWTEYTRLGQILPYIYKKENT